MLGQRQLLLVPSFPSVAVHVEESVLSPVHGLLIYLRPAESGPAADSKHIEQIPNELIPQLLISTAALSILSPS